MYFFVAYEKIAYMQLVINDILTNYEEFGQNNKVWLLILHGWGNSSRDWIPVAKRLSQSYHVLAVDLPGFGGTQQPKTVYGIYDYADFVEAVMKKLNITKYHVLGHSFGGRIGVILGSRSPHVSKLILVASSGTEKQALIRKVVLVFAKPIAKLLPANIVTKLARLFASTDYVQAGPMLEIFKKVVKEDLTSVLNLIHKDTLIIWGSNDKTLNVAQAKTFRDNTPNAKIKIFWGAGHALHKEKEDELCACITEFLNA